MFRYFTLDKSVGPTDRPTILPYSFTTSVTERIWRNILDGTSLCVRFSLSGSGSNPLHFNEEKGAGKLWNWKVPNVYHFPSATQLTLCGAIKVYITSEGEAGQTTFSLWKCFQWKTRQWQYTQELKRISRLIKRLIRNESSEWRTMDCYLFL